MKRKLLDSDNSSGEVVKFLASMKTYPDKMLGAIAGDTIGSVYEWHNIKYKPAADTMAQGKARFTDDSVMTCAVADGIMRALANKSTRPCTCPTFTDNKRRVYRIMQMLKDYKVQGVIYHVLRGCLVYDYEYRVLEEELGKLNIPVIRVESDYNEEDVEQLRIRVEAFIELIKYGKG